ncbi:MAG: hypothetical protein ACLQHF_06510 [Terracidiphilus sp.]
MEKHLSTIGYWLGLICAVLALIFRLVSFFHVLTVHIGVSGKPISHSSFLEAAELFFLLAIASWCRTAKS